MTRARDIANLVDANGDIVAGALDNVPASNDASALTTGTLAAARLPTTGVDASSLSTGTLASARLPSSGVDASSLTTGSLPAARIASNTITDAMIADGAGQYHPFIGFQQYSNSHNASGTISWSAQPAQGNTIASGGAFVKRNGNSTYTLNVNTFTCKSAGVYFVYACLIPVTSSSQLYMYVIKNGGYYTDNRSSGGGSYHENCYTQCICDLVVNDTIQIYCNQATHGGLYGQFSIFKLGEA